MATFLESAARGEIQPALLDAVLSSPGTALVIGQMNLMRRVSVEQYRTLLLGLGREAPPPLQPVGDDERSRNGVVGLTENVWPTLRWGMSHTTTLRDRIAEIKALDVSTRARDLAVAALPESVELSPQIFVVMGGRAGAAALDGSRIYVDILLLSFLDATGRRPWSAERDVLDFVAHEMHHLGYREVTEKHRASLQLRRDQEPAYRLLVSLLSEGSATYLVSNRRDVDRLHADRSLAGELHQQEELLAECARLLGRLVRQPDGGDSDADAVSSFLLGSRAHAAGSLMLSRIDRQGGLEAVMAVLLDPRTLLLRYNRAVDALPGANQMYRFDKELAESLVQLGERHHAGRR